MKKKKKKLTNARGRQSRAPWDIIIVVVVHPCWFIDVRRCPHCRTCGCCWSSFIDICSLWQIDLVE